MIDDIQRTGTDFDAALAGANDSHALDELRVRYFGRKGGLVPALFARLKEVPKEQKKDAGDALNKLRDRLESELKEKSERVAAEEAKRKEAAETLDVTLPARMPRLGLDKKLEFRNWIVGRREQSHASTGADISGDYPAPRWPLSSKLLDRWNSVLGRHST